MARHITHRRMSTGGYSVEHITDVKWNEGTSTSYSSTRAEMVAFVDQNPQGSAYVQGPYSRVDVTSVHPSGRPAYIKTVPNHTGTDNLLSLPTF